MSNHVNQSNIFLESRLSTEDNHLSPNTDWRSLHLIYVVFLRSQGGPPISWVPQKYQDIPAPTYQEPSITREDQSVCPDYVITEDVLVTSVSHVCTSHTRTVPSHKDYTPSFHSLCSCLHSFLAHPLFASQNKNSRFVNSTISFFCLSSSSHRRHQCITLPNVGEGRVNGLDYAPRHNGFTDIYIFWHLHGQEDLVICMFRCCHRWRHEWA